MKLWGNDDCSYKVDDFKAFPQSIINQMQTKELQDAAKDAQERMERALKERAKKNISKLFHFNNGEEIIVDFIEAEYVTDDKVLVITTKDNILFNINLKNILYSKRIEEED